MDVEGNLAQTLHTMGVFEGLAVILVLPSGFKDKNTEEFRRWEEDIPRDLPNNLYPLKASVRCMGLSLRFGISSLLIQHGRGALHGRHEFDKWSLTMLAWLEATARSSKSRRKLRAMHEICVLIRMASDILAP